jgi:hypothetical protein
VVFSVDECVVVDAFAVVRGAEVTLHSSLLSTLKTPFNVSIALLSGIWD